MTLMKGQRCEKFWHSGILVMHQYLMIYHKTVNTAAAVTIVISTQQLLCQTIVQVPLLNICTRPHFIAPDCGHLTAQLSRLQHLWLSSGPFASDAFTQCE